MARKFYKTVVTVVVLTEDVPPEYDNLSDLNYLITQGDASGQVTSTASEVLSGKQAAKALQAQGSDPSFFNIDDDGNDLE
jgi:hypothetical protein